MGDQKVDTHSAKLLRVVLTCGCILIPSPMSDQMSFHMLVTRSHCERVVCDENVENSFGQALVRYAQLWLQMHIQSYVLAK